MTQILRIRNLTVLLFMLVVAVSVDAFAATDEFLNIGPTRDAGVIKSYQVHNAAYVTHSDNNLAILEQVSFDLTPLDGAGRAAKVYVQVVSGSNNWFSCTAGSTYDWDCSTSIPVAQVNALNVVATE